MHASRSRSFLNRKKPSHYFAGSFPVLERIVQVFDPSLVLSKEYIKSRYCGRNHLYIQFSLAQHPRVTVNSSIFAAVPFVQSTDTKITVLCY